MATLRLRLILGACLLLASCAGAAHRRPEGLPELPAVEAIRREALGVSIHAFVQGPADADILVLSLHGWGASGAEGLIFGKALESEASAEADGLRGPSVRFVSPDLPGSGASDKPDAPYTPSWFVEVLDDFRESLGADSVVLAGHSLGGRLALEYTLCHPDRVEALLLFAPAGLSASFRALDRWALSRKGVVRAGTRLVSERSYLRFYKRRVVHDPEYAYPSIARWALDGLLTPEGRSALRAVTRNALAAPDLADRLVEIRVPVLLIWGKEDEVLRFETSELFLAGLSDVRAFLALDDCGHLPQTERSAETALAAYRFLSSIRADESSRR